MSNPAERLKEAREAAGYQNPTDAARAFGWKPSTYLGHENGSRGLRAEAAQRYAKAFSVNWLWLVGGGEGKPPAARAPTPTEVRSAIPSERETIISLSGMIETALELSVVEQLREEDSEDLRTTLFGKSGPFHEPAQKVLAARGLGLITKSESSVIQRILSARDLAQRLGPGEIDEESGLKPLLSEIVSEHTGAPPRGDNWIGLILTYGLIVTSLSLALAGDRETASEQLKALMTGKDTGRATARTARGGKDSA